MKRLLVLLMILPVFALAQGTGTIGAKKTAKPAPKKTATAVKAPEQKPASFNIVQIQPPGGFIVHGTITGYPDGTEIKMLNGQTGTPEQSVLIKNNAFTLTGKMAGNTPEFKIIGINGQEPFITLFIGNEELKLNTTKEDFTNAKVTGSPSQDDFAEFNNVSKPYEDVILGRGRFDVEVMDKAASVLSKFILQHKDSYVTPLVLFRYNQLTGDYNKLEAMYNVLTDRVKTTPIGTYIAQLVESNKKMDYGKPIADFTQPDTSGNNISLSSLKGKYVLVDFWASWCGPCRAENPNVVSSYEKYKNKNFTVLSVSLDREREPWIKAINNDHLNWSHVSDLKFWGNAVAQQFGITSIPQNFLLDPDGNLIGKNLRGAALEYKLSKVLH